VSGIRITGTSMSSPATPHTARAVGEGWEVSWLPGRTLTRNQAVTAMVIAYTVAGGAIRDSGDRVWPHLDNWAAELGLSGPDAVAQVSEPPGPGEPANRAGHITEPFGGARLCAHADRDGEGAHWLRPGETCEPETGQEPEAGA
jgi:hypothetical protein